MSPVGVFPAQLLFDELVLVVRSVELGSTGGLLSGVEVITGDEGTEEYSTPSIPEVTGEEEEEGLQQAQVYCLSVLLSRPP